MKTTHCVIKYLLLAAPMLLSGALPAPISGTWATGKEQGAQIFMFNVSGDHFTGVTCGPCTDPSTIFMIVGGKIADPNHATFFVVHDDGHRDQVAATLSGGELTLEGHREHAKEKPWKVVLKHAPDLRGEGSNK
jgi:hypothetical protein